MQVSSAGLDWIDFEIMLYRPVTAAYCYLQRILPWHGPRRVRGGGDPAAKLLWSMAIR
jgi:hypothetical protein